MNLHLLFCFWKFWVEHLRGGTRFINRGRTPRGGADGWEGGRMANGGTLCPTDGTGWGTSP